MGRRKKIDIVTDPNVQDNIIDQEFSSMMDENFTHYAFKVLEDRALPDARDGLKPSQRRTLYCMYHKLKLRAGAKTAKCAKITGQVSGDYHPHGDMVIYPTLVRLAQPWSLRYPLVYGQGNFGDVDGEPPAAQRYTEARLSKEGEAICADVDDSVVPFQATYNDESTEPTVMPGMFPNLLVNGGSGIAVGYASNLAPHNLREVVSVIKAYIENPKLTVDEVIKLMPGPDFPCPCVLLGQEGVRNYYETGRGSVRMEGLYEIDQDKSGNPIIRITEFPYGGNPKKFVKQLQELVQTKKIEGISDLKNLTRVVNRKAAINVMVWVSKGANPQVVLNQLLKHTCLRESFSVNTTVLIDGLQVAENVPILKLVDVFINHRKEVLRGKYTAELEKREARLHIIEGLIGITSRIDDVIKLIRASDGPDEAKAELISKGFVKSDEQAQAIIDIKLGNLTKLESDKLQKEHDWIKERIDWLNKVLSADKYLLKLIVKEQDELATTLGDDRITQIGVDADDIDAEDLIKREQIVISLSRDGYIKRLPVTEYNVQRRGGKGVNNISTKRNDETDIMFVASTHDNVLFFTTKGLMYKKRGYQIPEAGKTGKGTHLANLLSLDSNELVTNTIPMESLDAEGYILMTTRHGLIKKSEIRDYNTKFKTRGLQAIKLNDKDEVAFVETTQGDQDVFLVTANGKALRYSEDNIRVVDRVSKGVKAMKLKPDDSIAQMLTIDPKANPDILVVTEFGFGKRTNASEYRENSGRNGMGVATISKKNDRNGQIIGASAVTKDDTLIISTAKGKIIQMPIGQIRESSRQTMGVKLIDIEPTDAVRAIARVEGGMLTQEDE